MTAASVEVVDLVKCYPKASSNAVDGLSITVKPEEIFSLLGPNGAGKSTAIGILTTRMVKTSGHALVAGADVSREPILARSRLSVVPQRSNLDLSLTARQILVFHAAYHGVPRKVRHERADAMLEAFGLADRGRDSPSKYSGGMIQRLLVARALMHAPRVLFLDEPTTGLDPAARLFVWDRILELRRAGVTVMLTTHDMDEAAELSDRVGIIDHGRLLALDTPEALTRSLPGQTTLDVSVESTDALGALVDVLNAVDGVERTEPVNTDSSGGHRLRLYVTCDAARLLGPVSQALLARGSALSSVGVSKPSLEDVFIDLTGRDLR